MPLPEEPAESAPDVGGRWPYLGERELRPGPNDVSAGSLLEEVKNVGIAASPIYGTIHFWDQMKPWEKGLSIGLDVVDLAIPIIPIRAGLVGLMRTGGKGRAAVKGVENVTKSLKDFTEVVDNTFGKPAKQRLEELLKSFEQYSETAVDVRQAEAALDSAKVRNEALERRLLIEEAARATTPDAVADSGLEKAVRVIQETARGPTPDAVAYSGLQDTVQESRAALKTATETLDKARVRELANEGDIRKAHGAFGNALVDAYQPGGKVAEDLKKFEDAIPEPGSSLLDSIRQRMSKSGLGRGPDRIFFDTEAPPIESLIGTPDDVIAQVRNTVSHAYHNVPQAIASQQQRVADLARDTQKALANLDFDKIVLKAYDSERPSASRKRPPLGEVVDRTAAREVATKAVSDSAEAAAAKATELTEALSDLGKARQDQVPILKARIDQLDQAIKHRTEVLNLPANEIAPIAKERADLTNMIYGLALNEGQDLQTVLTRSREVLKELPGGKASWSPTMLALSQKADELAGQSSKHLNTLEEVWNSRPPRHGGGFSFGGGGGPGKDLPGSGGSGKGLTGLADPKSATATSPGALNVAPAPSTGALGSLETATDARAPIFGTGGALRAPRDEPQTEQGATTAKGTAETETETETETVTAPAPTKPRVPATDDDGDGSETRKVPEVETETETEKVPEVETETETEKVPEVETETETEKVPEVETETETEKVPEEETETETEKVPEEETETETEKVPEEETETETQKVPEEETETETQKVPEEETETPPKTTPETGRSRLPAGRSIRPRVPSSRQPVQRKRSPIVRKPNSAGSYPSVVAWRSGFGHTIHNLTTGKTRFSKRPPAGVPNVSGKGAARRSFTVLQRGARLPTQRQLDKGAMTVVVGPGGTRHRRKRRRR